MDTKSISQKVPTGAEDHCVCILSTYQLQSELFVNTKNAKQNNLYMDIQFSSHFSYTSTGVLICPL